MLYMLYGLCPTPYTLHPTPYTLQPIPFTLHPTPHTLHPLLCTPHPTTDALHPALCPTPYALCPLWPSMAFYVLLCVEADRPNSAVEERLVRLVYNKAFVGYNLLPTAYSPYFIPHTP